MSPAATPALLLYAHRGASHDAPENTLAAFRLGWEQGADGVECDVRLTRDGQLVCIHDGDTFRTTGVRRRVATSTWDALRGLDAGTWKSPAFAGARIPLLASVLEALPRDQRIQVEVKCGAEAVPVLVPLLRALPAWRERVLVISFHAAVLHRLHQVAPDVSSLLLVSYRRAATRLTNWLPSTTTLLRQLRACGAAGLGSQAHVALSAERVRVLSAAGFTVGVWTVDHPGKARRFARHGCTMLTTNRPGWLRAQLAVG